MTGSPPARVAINHDDYAARYVGRTADGRQFFLTTPFIPARDTDGTEFIALYVFDRTGALLEAQIESLGPRNGLDVTKAKARRASLLAGLGNVEYGRIEVAPFSIERFDVQFGLIVREPEEDGAPWAVEAQPGNYMAFFQPWDSGEYDT